MISTGVCIDCIEVDILENKLTEVMMINAKGCDSDYKKGYKSAIKFCIERHKEGWVISQFEEDLEEVVNQYGLLSGDYLDGIISGLEYNIKLMRN